MHVALASCMRGLKHSWQASKKSAKSEITRRRSAPRCLSRFASGISSNTILLSLDSILLHLVWNSRMAEFSWRCALTAGPSRSFYSCWSASAINSLTGLWTCGIVPVQLATAVSPVGHGALRELPLRNGDHTAVLCTCSSADAAWSGALSGSDFLRTPVGFVVFYAAPSAADIWSLSLNLSCLHVAILN